MLNYQFSSYIWSSESSGYCSTKILMPLPFLFFLNGWIKSLFFYAVIFASGFVKSWLVNLAYCYLVKFFGFSIPIYFLLASMIAYLYLNYWASNNWAPNIFKSAWNFSGFCWMLTWLSSLIVQFSRSPLLTLNFICNIGCGLN